MTRRRLLILAACFAAVGAAWWVLRPSEAERAYNRIRLGMTLKEVEAVIGVPSSYYIRTGPDIRLWPSGIFARESGIPSETLGDIPDVLVAERWTLGDTWVQVAFDTSGKAVGYYLVVQPTLLDRVRRFLGL